MPITLNRGYRYPSLDAPPNVPLAMQALAEDVDKDVQAVDARATPAKQAVDAATADVTPGALVKRSATGNILVSEPTVDGHPATKGYVDARTPTRVFGGQVILSLPSRDVRVTVTIRPTTAQLPPGDVFVAVSPQAQNQNRRIFAYVTGAYTEALSAAVWRDDDVTTNLGVNFVAVRMPPA